MLTVYIKPTNYCNVGCDHCYLPEEVRKDKSRMDLSQWRASIRFARSIAKARGDDSIQLIWHGGDPFVLPPDWMMEAGLAAREELDGVRHSQAIQSSIIPFRREHVPVVHEIFGGGIGSSIDFTQRTIGGSVDNYLELFMRKVDIARENGIHVGCIMVPTVKETQKGKAKWIVDWMEGNGFDGIHIERFNDFGSGKGSPLRPSNAQQSHFLIEMFDVVVERFVSNGTLFVTNTVYGALNGILRGVSGDKWGTTCQHDFVIINPDGRLNTCPDRIEEEIGDYGRVQDGVKNFLESTTRKKWVRHSRTTHQKSWCMTCEFNSWCKSGCPLIENEPYPNCSGFKPYLLHVKDFCRGNRSVAREILSSLDEVLNQ
ncbi:MAG: SPASM domain-containing protein [Methanobacteriota archaeon]|nr:MAG: SPASM domain-containing protein [Euryarchaeota archaeon]